jgi:hypothetical protein
VRAEALAIFTILFTGSCAGVAATVFNFSGAVPTDNALAELTCTRALADNDVALVARNTWQGTAGLRGCGCP